MSKFIIHNAQVITMDKNSTVFFPGSIVISEDKIIAIGPDERILSSFPDLKTWDANEKVVIPGLINTHAHLFQTFMRGIGKDLPLIAWLKKAVRPVTPHMNADDCYLAALVGCIEAVRSGTTTILDFMYINSKPELHNAVAQAFTDIGMRAVLGRAIHDIKFFPDGSQVKNYEDPDIGFKEIERLRIKFQNDSLLRLAISPSTVWAVSKEQLREIAKYSEEYEILVTMHTNETELDDEYSLQKYGKTTFGVLEDSGVLNNPFLAVHCVKLSEQDIEIISKNNVSVSHNPVANMILADGVAPIPKLKNKNVTIGLATDGAASNDSHSMIEVMKTASLLQKTIYLDPAILSAQDVFHMATISGAKSLNMNKETGSIEVGKKADLVILNMMRANTIPSLDPIPSLVYSGNSTNIESVIINGKWILKENQFVNINEEEIILKANQNAMCLLKRANVI